MGPVEWRVPWGKGKCGAAGCGEVVGTTAHEVVLTFLPSGPGSPESPFSPGGPR